MPPEVHVDITDIIRAAGRLRSVGEELAEACEELIRAAAEPAEVEPTGMRMGREALEAWRKLRP